MISIINYGRDNLDAVTGALDILEEPYCIASLEYDICHADKIIFPGSDELKRVIKNIHLMNLFSMMRMIRKPVLAIDSGMQLLCEYFRAEKLTCLGIYPAEVFWFEEGKGAMPYKGEHKVNFVKDGVLSRGFEKETNFYFNNSLYIPEIEETTGISENGVRFSSVIEKDHFYGVQFHPEQSGDAGLRLLKNFAAFG